MRTLAVAILAGLLMQTGASLAEANTWRTYANARFGASAEYPSDRFLASPPPENGDGLRFQSSDGANLAIYGSYNINDATPQSYEAIIGDDPGRTVTYRAMGKDWLALSGIRGDEVFYEKYLFRGDVIEAMSLTYPRWLKTTYDPIAARIARSLRANKVYSDGKCVSNC